jgi:hypothetical protein
MTATAVLENATGAEKISTKDDRLHRGRRVTMAFLIQGWGQFLNQAILIVLLLIFQNGRGNPPYSKRAAQLTYRVSFVFPAVGTLWLVCKYSLISYCHSEDSAPSWYWGSISCSFYCCCISSTPPFYIPFGEARF